MFFQFIWSIDIFHCNYVTAIYNPMPGRQQISLENKENAEKISCGVCCHELHIWTYCFTYVITNNTNCLPWPFQLDRNFKETLPRIVVFRHRIECC